MENKVRLFQIDRSVCPPIYSERLFEHGIYSKYAMFLKTSGSTPPDEDLTPTTMESSITKNDIIWTFDTTYQVGQFANGDYFVIIPEDGEVNIIDINPGVTTDGEGDVINGSMINPTVNYAYQGFDENVSDFGYNASVNVGIGISGETPLGISSPSSLISTISRVPDTNHSFVKSAEILTFLSSVPLDGSFRPPYVGTDKTIQHNISELDYSKLESVTTVSGAPSLVTAEALFQKPWLEFNTNPQCASIHPADNMPWYGRDIARDIGIGALVLQLDYTDAQKENLMIYYTQLGLDLYSIIAAGGEWVANGGHSGGRKWPILFTGIVLNDTNMKAIGNKSGDYLYSGSYYEGNQPPDYISFGEDDQTFYVTQRDIDRGVGYVSGDLGLEEWGISHNLSPSMDDPDWAASYRTTSFTCMSGCLLAAMMMETSASSRTLWNHLAIFDYIVRFMGLSSANDTFTQNMWDTYYETYY